MSVTTGQTGQLRADLRSLAHLCQEAAGLLDQARQLPVDRLSEEVDEVERAIARLRDGLIEQLRQSDRPGGIVLTPEQTKPLRTALDHANVALSLVCGVEYPATGFHRKFLDQAAEVLSQVDLSAVETSE